ncbi:MAG: nucleoside triphosphate pyrophosphohydrolase [Clostridia bacterium]|nr:nucleoside triphosphate pyrophosphohydrolase [Clostridia bacterium]MDD4665750.1 nucleoside triphosphate pyrophosphohydrolase [Clostridia bacterium]
MKEIIVKGESSSVYPLDPLANILDRLLAKEGCPWDREQTHFTLKPCLLEEAYEVIEAIDLQDMDKLKEELGDVLLQIVFHTALAQQRGDFTLNDVIAGITNKMIRRHPHVFGEATVQGTADVLKNWEEIKKAEKGNNMAEGRIMTSINRALPALLMAEEVQKKAKKVGFDWENVQGPWEKIKEELQELAEVIDIQDQEGGNKVRIEEELGDLLFAVVNVARFAGVSSETALYKTIRKFVQRFNFIEQEILAQGSKWEDMDLHFLDEIWEKAKLKGL